MTVVREKRRRWSCGRRRLRPFIAREPSAQGGSIPIAMTQTIAQAFGRATAGIGQQTSQQAQLLAYAGAFRFLAAACCAAIPAFLRRVKPGLRGGH